MRKSGAYFTNEGELHIPASVPRPKELNHPLTLKEWVFWLFFTAENKRNDYNKWTENLVSRTTHWRIRKKLTEKGYF